MKFDSSGKAESRNTITGQSGLEAICDAVQVPWQVGAGDE